MARPTLVFGESALEADVLLYDLEAVARNGEDNRLSDDDQKIDEQLENTSRSTCGVWKPLEVALDLCSLVVSPVDKAQVGALGEKAGGARCDRARAEVPEAAPREERAAGFLRAGRHRRATAAPAADASGSRAAGVPVRLEKGRAVRAAPRYLQHTHG